MKSGILKIVEVESRFTKVKLFIELLQKLGFDLQSESQPNGYFLSFEFVKSDREMKSVENIKADKILKPCLYKKR